MLSNALAILGLLATPLCWLFSLRLKERASRILLVLVGAIVLTTLLVWACVWAEELEMAWALRRFKEGSVYHWDIASMRPSERDAYHRWHTGDLGNRFAMLHAPLSGLFFTGIWNGVLLLGAFVLRRWTPFHQNIPGR